MTTNYTFWNNTSEHFLTDDRANAARAAVVSILTPLLSQKKRITLLEIGFGPGFDLLDHFWPLIANRQLTYIGYDGAAAMVEKLQRAVMWRAADSDTEVVKHITLKHKALQQLDPATADVVYAKAVLEHQVQLTDPLTAMILAAKQLAIINWYRPPAAHKKIDYDTESDIYSITWERVAVETILRNLNCTWTTKRMPDPPHNELWIVKR